MVGNKYLHQNGTLMEVATIIGNYYRVKNHSAGHTSSYEIDEFEDDIAKGVIKRVVDKQDTLKLIKKYLTTTDETI